MDKLKSQFEEITPNQESYSDSEKEREERVAEILRLVEEINRSGESLSFPGIHPEVYSRMKADEDEYPDYTTPIDELITRFQDEGIKVVLGKHPKSGNVFILPANSTDIEMDSIAPRQLSIDAVVNKQLKELIQLTTKK